MPLYNIFGYQVFFPDGYKINVDYPTVTARHRGENYLIYFGEDENDIRCLSLWERFDGTANDFGEILVHENLDKNTTYIVNRAVSITGDRYNYTHAARKYCNGRIIIVWAYVSRKKDKDLNKEVCRTIIDSISLASSESRDYTPINMPSTLHYQIAQKEMDKIKKIAQPLTECAATLQRIADSSYDRSGNWPLTIDEAIASVEEFSRHSHLPRFVSIPLGDTVMLFTLIPPGAFFAGGFSDENESSCLRPVTIKKRELSQWSEQVVPMTYPFYMTISPITQRQWLAATGANPSFFQAIKEHLEHPTEMVGWNDIVESFLPAIRNLVCDLKVDLPDEIEWEYACKAGTGTFFNFGNNAKLKYFNFNGLSMYDNIHLPNKLPKNVISMTTPPGMYPANAWGLYDMHGNVREWCGGNDQNYPHTISSTQKGCVQKITRGGSFTDFWEDCTSFEYHPMPFDTTNSFTGFRLVIKRS